MSSDQTIPAISLPMDPVQIMRYQQNRFPLLFLDKVIDVQVGRSASAVKNFSYNEWFFPAHFEDEPVVPGFVLIESLVQTFLMTFLTLPGNAGSKTSFMSIDEARFLAKVTPGDSLTIESTLKSFERGLATGSAAGFVEGRTAIQASFRVSIPEKLNEFLPKREKFEIR